jgi:hypothetical protein
VTAPVAINTGHTVRWFILRLPGIVVCHLVKKVLLFSTSG